jgi:hypothetical protein
MNIELTKKLLETFPALYQTPLGFECDDGWFQIIWDLSEALEREILQISKEERNSYIVKQVKEKYGSLRFYMLAPTNEMLSLIKDAEKKSSKSCEKCGSPGILRGKSWVYTSCDKHIRS